MPSKGQLETHFDQCLTEGSKGNKGAFRDWVSVMIIPPIVIVVVLEV
jgi:hypothetical protein